MDTREEEFLKRLKATFKIEADEHVQTISSGLLDLENSPDSEKRARILETIYREAHSLKGAARAVNLRDVEKICQAMETVLSLLKKEELQPPTHILDTLLDSVEGVAKLISTDDVFPTGDLLQRLSDITSEPAASPDSSPSSPESLASIVSNYKPPKPDEPVTPELSDQLPPTSEQPFASMGPNQTSVRTIQTDSKRSAQAETIRIQSSKLDSLLYQVEEMVAVKMAVNQRVSDLKNVKLNLDLHGKQWAKVYPEVRILKGIVQNPESYGTTGNYRPQLLKIIDFLESNEATLKTIEGRLKTLTSMAENDSRQASSMVDDLLEDMKSVLMLPSSTLLEMFPRLVRDLSGDQKKKIKFTIDGGDIEIDRRILEEMKDPLIHLVRNAIDHGLEGPAARTRNGKSEEGSLSISISQLGAKKAEIVVTDNGSGIDPEIVKLAALRRNIITEQELHNISNEEAIYLIFKSEVSTSPIITDLSGRGLGLAIVREKVEKLGGIVIVESKVGVGTVFRMQLPVTLATFRGTLTKVGSELFVIPTVNVIRAGRVKRDSIRTVENRATITMNGRVLSLVRMTDILEIEPGPDEDEESQFVTIVILGVAEQKIAFSVDAILNEQEVLVKSMGRQLSRVRNVSAGTVLGSGQVALILNVSDMIRSAMRITGESLFAHTKKSQEVLQKKSILVVEDSITSRMLLKNILESAGY
ncbi:MAG: ATP-binding protein, partial [Desulfomonilaceae bacterium]